MIKDIIKENDKESASLDHRFFSDQLHRSCSHNDFSDGSYFLYSINGARFIDGQRTPMSNPNHMIRSCYPFSLTRDSLRKKTHIHGIYNNESSEIENTSDSNNVNDIYEVDLKCSESYSITTKIDNSLKKFFDGTVKLIDFNIVDINSIEDELNALKFIKNLKRIELESSTEDVLDFIYSEIDSLLLGKKFDSCNVILEKIETFKISEHSMIGILTITYPFKNQLPYRAILFSEIKNYFVLAYGNNEASKILSGLE